MCAYVIWRVCFRIRAKLKAHAVQWIRRGVRIKLRFVYLLNKLGVSCTHILHTYVYSGYSVDIWAFFCAAHDTLCYCLKIQQTHTAIFQDGLIWHKIWNAKWVRRKMKTSRHTLQAHNQSLSPVSVTTVRWTSGRDCIPIHSQHFGAEAESFSMTN